MPRQNVMHDGSTLPTDDEVRGVYRTQRQRDGRWGWFARSSDGSASAPRYPVAGESDAQVIAAVYAEIAEDEPSEDEPSEDEPSDAECDEPPVAPRVRHAAPGACRVLAFAPRPRPLPR